MFVLQVWTQSIFLQSPVQMGYNFAFLYEKTLLAFATCFSLYATGQGRAFFLLHPPDLILPKGTKVAVVEFAGDKGGDCTDKIITEMSDPKRGIPATVENGFMGFGAMQKGITLQPGATSAIHELMDRSQMGSISAEQAFLNDNSALNAAKTLGVDFLVSGRTSLKKFEKLSGGCVVRDGVCEVSVKIIDARTSKIIGTKTITGNGTYKSCGTETPASYNQLLDWAVADAAYKVANYISPHFVRVDVHFVKNKVKEYKEDSKRALKFVDDNKFNEAFTLYKQIYDKDNYCAEAAYNMGLLYLIYGNFGKSVEFLGKAAEIDAKEYSGPIALANSYDAFAKELREKALMELPLEEFNGNALVVKQVAAPQVHTRGSKSDRYDVLDQPKDGASLVNKVPGNTPFELVSQDGGWVQIKLLGGKQGFIKKDSVRM